MPTFRIHWSQVTGVALRAPDGMVLVALWPSPVNPDECFAAAGFTDFGDSDAAWDAESAAALDRLIGELTTFGAPTLLSEPIAPRVPVISRIFAAHCSSRSRSPLNGIPVPIVWWHSVRGASRCAPAAATSSTG